MPAITTEIFTFCSVTTGAAGVPFLPVKLLGDACVPYSNTRQIVILNTSVNPILFSVVSCPDQTFWPVAFGGTQPLAIAEGVNATRIPAGASLSIDLGSFQERGNFQLGPSYIPPGIPPLAEFPLNLITFASTAAGVATADITYINRYGVY
jgi:hypothetical protein